MKTVNGRKHKNVQAEENSKPAHFLKFNQIKEVPNFNCEKQ